MLLLNGALPLDWGGAFVYLGGMNPFEKLSPKQKLIKMVVEEAQTVKAQAHIVQVLEGQVEAGLLLAENDTIRLDPELHQLMLVHLDAKLALARAGLMVAEYCAKKVNKDQR